ncbi:MAG: hypothetical protein V2A78_12115 [bacterium]
MKNCDWTKKAKMSDSLIKALLLIIGITPASVIVIFLFLNPDKFERWMALFYKFLYFISSGIPKLSRRIDSYTVASSIQDTVNSICENINKDSPNVFPHPLKIEWVKTENKDSFIKDGKVVVCLKSYKNQSKNIVDATLMFLKVGLLPKARSFLDVTLRAGCEFKVAAGIFSARRDTNAYDYFIDTVLNPAISGDSNLSKDLQLLEDLDSVGFFTRVFLTEVKATGEKLLGTIPTTAVKQELRIFAKFLQTIANKRPEEDVPLHIKGLKVNVAVVLIARRDKLTAFGIEPYIKRISRCVEEGYESIYVTGMSDECVRAVVEMKKSIEGIFVSVLRRYDYLVRRQTKAIMLVCQSNFSYLTQRRQLQEEVKIAFEDIVPEVKNGEVELVSIARKRGNGCKVAVRMSSETADGRKAAIKCVGTGGQRLNEIKERLKEKFVVVIPWASGIKEYITNALHLINAGDVNLIEIDEENLIATVALNTDDACKTALGYQNNSLILASELTGWLIKIKGPKRSEMMLTPEDEMKKKLEEKISEISNCEIEIVRIARIKGVGTKAIVRWANAVPPRKRASDICSGADHAVIRSIKEETGEWIHFHEWCDKPERQVANCLYPLKSNDLESIKLDEAQNIATITIYKNTTANNSWRNQHNLALAERVTGWRIEVNDSRNYRPSTDNQSIQRTR